MTRWTYRLGLAVAAGALATVAAAGVAFAHVTIHPVQAQRGSYEAFSLRVPTERDNASTVKVVVAFPADNPIRSVSVRPHPGWSYQVKYLKYDKPKTVGGKEVTQVVSRITWTANSPQTAIKPGEYDEFSISAGPLPEVDHIDFKSLQYYSSGEIVRWIQESEPGQPEPENPVPEVTLLSADDTGASRQPETKSTSGTARASVSQASGGAMWPPMCIAIAALVIAVGAGSLTWRRRGL